MCVKYHGYIVGKRVEGAFWRAPICLNGIPFSSSLIVFEIFRLSFRRFLLFFIFASVTRLSK